MLAVLPIVLILLLMIGARWSAARAGSAGLLAALLIAWFQFGLGTTVLPELGVARATGGALAEAVFLALTIVWIILPALCIHALQVRTGSMDVLQQAMGRISGDPRITALLVAWFFVLFVEGAAGFGTPVALAAPFLVSAGFAPVTAVSIALIGNALGVSFGAVGTPVLPQVASTGLMPLEVSGATARYHMLLGWLMPLIVMALAARNLMGDKRKPMWAWAVFAAACFLLPFYLLARYVGPELPTLGGALLGALAFIAALKLIRGRPSSHHAHAPQSGAALLRASAPYLFLIALITASRLVPPLQELLREPTLSWAYAAFSGRMEFLYHPGTLLMLSFLLGAWAQRASLTALQESVADVLRKLVPVTIALVAMLSLSRVMVHAGMIETLAATASAAAGQWWPLFAPAIGALGTFVTGSATASNILFTEFQAETAQRLGLSVLSVTAAQGFGATVGNLIAPHNIVAASATVSLIGREGEVLRRTMLVAFVYVALAGLATYFLLP